MVKQLMKTIGWCWLFGVCCLYYVSLLSKKKIQSRQCPVNHEFANVFLNQTNSTKNIKTETHPPTTCQYFVIEKANTTKDVSDYITNYGNMQRNFAFLPSVSLWDLPKVIQTPTSVTSFVSSASEYLLEHALFKWITFHSSSFFVHHLETFFVSFSLFATLNVQFLPNKLIIFHLCWYLPKKPA